MAGGRLAPVSVRRRRIIATALAALFVLSFVAAITTHAARQNLGAAAFYRQSLDDAHAYDRAYDEILFDPALTRQVGDLLGGVDIPTEEIKAVVTEIAPPGRLRSAVEDATGRVLRFMNSGDRLELALDVTAFVEAITEAVLTFTVDAIGSLPEERAATYVEFLDRFEAVLVALDGGEIPSTIPAFEIPERDIDAIADVVFQVGHIEPHSELGEAVRQAVAQDNVAGAIKVATASILVDRIAAAIEELVSGLDTGPDGEILLAAPVDVTDKVASRLRLPRRVLDLAGPGRVTSAGLALAAIAALVVVTWRDRRKMLRWTGATLACAGVAAAVFWLIARAVAVGRIEDVVVKQAPGFPDTFSRLVEDVLNAAAAQLAPGFWIPAAVAAAIGLVLCAASFAVPRAAGQQRVANGQ